MLAVRYRGKPYSDPDWAFEAKWDGIRALVTWDGQAMTLHSRTGRTITGSYPELAGATFGRPCVLDGEIVALDQTGRPSFGLLQGRMNLRSRGDIAAAVLDVPVAFLVFDLLYDGEEIIGLPWRDRRQRLEQVELSRPYALSGVEIEHGEALWEAVQERGLEGMVAKRIDSPYRPGVRSPEWRKLANTSSLRAVVGGFTPGLRSRRGTFGSLLVGLVDGDRLRYVGSVGTGFDAATLRAIRGALDQMSRPESPFHPDPGIPKATWVEPSLVAVVEFKEWTRPGHLRAPAFKGLSDDPWESVTWEAEGPGA